MQRFCRAEQTVLQRPVEERKIGLLPALVLEALERGRSKVEHGEYVAQARGDPFPALQRPSEYDHRDIRRIGERGGDPRQLPVVAARPGRGPA